MNDTHLHTVHEGDGDGGWVSTLREADVRELFVTLGKAVRAYQLYDENNPVYQRFVSALREAFRLIWKSEDQLAVGVEEFRIVLHGVPVYVNESRSESLAFLFYKDGIRELIFLPGIEEEEMEPFLSVLHRARHAGPESDDLLTILWEQDLHAFRFSYVDVLAEDVLLPEPGPGAGADQLMLVREKELGEQAGEEAKEEEGAEEGRGGDEPPQTLSQDSFNPTLYALDPREMELLGRELQVELGRDLRTEVLNALFDRLEEPSNVERQSQIIDIFRTLLPNFLGRGAIDAAASVLEELKNLEAAPDVFDEKRREQVGRLLDEVSSPTVMEELVHALEAGSIAPTPRQLDDFLVHLRAQALAPLLRATETVMVKELQPVLRSAVRGIADRYRRVLVELLASDDPLVAAGAARLAGSLQVTEAASALQGLLGHRDSSVRLAAIDAAVALRASTVAGALQDSLTDEDRSVRIAAARALGRLRYRPAARHFRELVVGRAVRAADVTEKIAFFEAYGELGDPEAAGLLDKLLNGKGMLGRREPADVRAAAALALGKVRSPEAQRALQSAASDEDAVVRSAVNRALRDAGEAAP